MTTKLGRTVTRPLTAVAFAAAVLVGIAGAPVSAVDGSNGSPGFCQEGEGTTVVVDATALGGDVIVRCAPGTDKRTGFETLEAAGFEYESTTGSGMSAVCRLEGRPAADEELDIDGKSGYSESCSGMPPAEAYWSYWRADDGAKWGFSQKGPQAQQKSTDFEAWTFALNATPDEPATPAIDPASPEGDSGASGTQNGVEWTGGEDQADADAASATDDSGSDVAPWVAGGVIVALVVMAVVTAVRRRARRGTESQ